MFGNAVIINENQRGLLFKKGVYKKLLMPGKYRATKNKQIETLDLDRPIASSSCSLSKLLEKSDIKDQVGDIYEVKENQLALRYTDGVFADILTYGKHVFWKDAGNIELKIIDISDPETTAGISPDTFSLMPQSFYKKIDVPAHYAAQLYINNAFTRVLTPGVYYFWNSACPVAANLIYTGKNKLDVMGQEVLTQDKVTLRVSFVCYYTVTNLEKLSMTTEELSEMIHVSVQLALRDYIGGHAIDAILAGKDEMSAYVLSRLKEKEDSLYIEFSDAGVKDIILPGEIRDIMNTVLIAEKQAQANVIARREEVASTRSLLNTAKLMDENKTLYKLKELEYAERICQHVGNINLNGNSDLLSQLSELLTKR